MPPQKTITNHNICDNFHHLPLKKTSISLGNNLCRKANPIHRTDTWNRLGIGSHGNGSITRFHVTPKSEITQGLGRQTTDPVDPVDDGMVMGWDGDLGCLGNQISPRKDWVGLDPETK